MSADEYSCIRDVEKEVDLTLPFSYVGRTLAGIKAGLENWKTQYVKCLEGILIDYKNVSFVESLGRMLLEQPFIHYKVKATFSIFKPHCGCILRGMVNRISKTHIGCVVHQFINVSIHLSPNTAEEIAKYVFLDSEILFQVSNVDAQRRVIRVKGEITPESVELMKKLLPHWGQSKHTFFDADTLPQGYSAADDNLVHLTPPSSTGSPNRVVSPDDNSTSGFESLNPEVEETPQRTVAKTPKKKRKRKEIEDESTLSAFPDFGSSRIISSTPFEMPHKKHKLNNPVSATSFLDYNFATSMNLYPSNLCAKKDRDKNKEPSIDCTGASDNQNNSPNNLTIPTTSISSEQSSETVGKKDKKLKKEKNSKLKNLKSPKTKDKKSKKSPDSTKDKSKSKKQKKRLKESGMEKNSSSLKSRKKSKSLEDKSKIKKRDDKDKKRKKSKKKLATSVPELSVIKAEIKEEF